MYKNSFYSMIPCERAIEMCDVIPDVSVDIPSDLILVKKEVTENIQISHHTFP